MKVQESWCKQATNLLLQCSMNFIIGMVFSKSSDFLCDATKNLCMGTTVNINHMVSSIYAALKMASAALGTFGGRGLLPCGRVAGS
jgi:hypothetical protein